mgnify:CR=1 FL=1
MSDLCPNTVCAKEVIAFPTAQEVISSPPPVEVHTLYGAPRVGPSLLQRRLGFASGAVMQPSLLYRSLTFWMRPLDFPTRPLENSFGPTLAI